MREGFDVTAFEEERAKLDKEARKAMEGVAEIQQAAEEELPGSVAGAWKWAIRQHVWDTLEAKNIARTPRPVHHR